MGSTAGVTVVIASFNGAEFIAEQLESIAAQTAPPAEIIIGDDRSEDDTVAIVERFAATNSIPVHLTVNDRRLGHSQNFLVTVLRAKGDLIAFSDQDDVWLPRKIAVATQAFADPTLCLWVHGFTAVDEHLRPLPDHRFHSGFALRSAMAYPLHIAHGSRAVFRADLLRYMPPAPNIPSVCGDGPMHHDEWTVFAAHALGRVGLERSPMILYRRHGQAASIGAPTKESRRGMLAGDHRPPHDEAVAAAEARIEYLRQRAVAAECAGVAERLIQARRYYESLLPKLGRRSALHGAGTRAQKAVRLTNGVLHGDYGQLERGGLGLFALLQDGYAVIR